ncbi:glycosyltransferase [Sporosarcina sp. P19]|uniref:glycosyltransferase n=1 Tax=Sporosarcina sp. P19 TaxID=2048258 RepID=UPI00130418C1|nr:glycosyltransferase family 2 protein [Sporosarcina sp. P19]
MLTTGIVILNYNDSETVISLLRKITLFTSINHIVVVDNCSTDNSFEKLKGFESNKCNILKTKFNGGYAYGNNFGAKYLINRYKPELILIANPDIDIEENFIIGILETFKHNQQYALLSGVVLDKNGNVTNSYINTPSYMSDLGSCTIFYRILNRFRSSNKVNYDMEILKVDIPIGSFFAIRTSVLKEINFMDEGTFLFYEENILATKLKSHGYYAGIITGLSYIHMHSTTIRKTLKTLQTHKIHLNSKYYFQTNYRDINKFQKILLKSAMRYSMLETMVLTPFKNFIKIWIISKYKRLY